MKNQLKPKGGASAQTSSSPSTATEGISSGEFCHRGSTAASNPGQGVGTSSQSCTQLLPLATETVSEDQDEIHDDGGEIFNENEEEEEEQYEEEEQRVNIADDSLEPSYNSSISGATASAAPATSTRPGDEEYENSTCTEIEIIFIKDGVSIRPHPNSQILGRVSLVKQHHALFLAWLPYPSSSSSSSISPPPPPPPSSSSSSATEEAKKRQEEESLQKEEEEQGEGPSQRNPTFPKKKKAARSAYAVHPVPLSEVRAIRPSTPPLRQHTVTLVLQSGITLPPFHFHKGGVRAFMSALRHHTHLMPSADDPGVYLVNDFADPLIRSLNTLELSHALSTPFFIPSTTNTNGGGGGSGGENLTSASTTNTTTKEDNNSLTPAEGGRISTGAMSWPLALWQLEDGDVTNTTSANININTFSFYGGGGNTNNDGYNDDVGAPNRMGAHLRELADKVGRFTDQARGVASSFLSGSMVIGGAPLAEHLALLGRATVAAGGGDDGVSFDVGSENLFFSEGAGGAAAVAVVASSSSQNGVVGNDDGGDHHSLTTATPTSPSAAAAAAAAAEFDGFAGWEVIERSSSLDKISTGQPSWTRPPPPPFSLEELLAMQDDDGRVTLSGLDLLRERAFSSGIANDARLECWKYILGLHAVGSSTSERNNAAAARLKKYLGVRRQWHSIGEEQSARWSQWRERKSLIDKDVRRTDRSLPFFRERSAAQTMLRRILLTYAIWNFDLGYAQGMSDLASPLLFVVRTAAHPWEETGSPLLSVHEQDGVESETFWMFVAVMEGMQANFSIDHNGMHGQLAALRHLLAILDPPLHAHLARHDALSLFFCYRWILILFKREFKFDQLLRLWPALWARPRSQLHLFLAAALLCRHRRQIIEDNLDFDGLLELCVKMSGKIDLEMALADAAMLKEVAGERGAAAVAGLPSLI